MYLKKLELSGFKSFARAIALEFPKNITAVVGPNGSGKSNIKEAVQWVMGEQSMKSLRGKKGEDLIWNGSPQTPRVGKASVVLHFDNSDGAFPIGSDEVRIERKIYRDGLNEYSINRSQVRLKDVVELIARIGLGETKHNIVGQGEVDRILLSNPKERKAMIEEALGLRVYQLKKNETLRKLEHTDANISQGEALVREIAPHLKFLKIQAEKAEKREEVANELQEFQKIYFVRESSELERERAAVEKESAPLKVRLEDVRDKIGALEGEIGVQEQKLRDAMSSSENRELHDFEKRRRECERELGRLEGKLEVERERANTPKIHAVNMPFVEGRIRAFAEAVKSVISGLSDFESAQTRLKALLLDIERTLGEIREGISEEEADHKENSALRGIEESIESIRNEISALGESIDTIQSEREEERKSSREMQMRLRELDASLRAKQDEERDLLLHLERIKFSEERIRIREAAFEQNLHEANMGRDDLAGVSVKGYEAIAVDEIKRKIECFRARLEEIGGIDPAVVKEYEDTNARYTFLETELGDLKRAHESLKTLIEELEEHIEKDFKEGFAKIKDEFHNYFRIIFGGGRASLSVVKIPIRGVAPEDAQKDFDEIGEEPELSEGAYVEGIEMVVDFPRKRIKGLSMLSGGERALTSIALLFAIAAVNPPPFLILDETDAALDEANSQRYAAILKELAKKTQLILVTHNRETMKCAGILYGVTMGDDGVSKLLSLKLEEAEVYTNR